MKIRHRISSCLTTLTAFGGILLSPSAQADKASIEVPFIRAIQTFNTGENASDQIYLLITGVANGKDFSTRFPESKPGEKIKTAEAAHKKYAVSSKTPLVLWKGELGEGEYAFLNVALFQGSTLTADQEKAYREKIAGAAITEIKKYAKLDPTSATTGIKAAHDAHAKAAAKIKELFSRNLKTDHYNGSFNVCVYNDGKEVHKELYPVGLLAGEHYGTDLKLYTKIKYTLDNVPFEEDGDWSEVQLGPMNQDKDIVRVKFLETEMVPGKGEPVRNVTDYVIELMVKAGHPLGWRVTDEVTGESLMHHYWNSAE